MDTDQFNQLIAAISAVNSTVLYAVHALLWLVGISLFRIFGDLVDPGWGQKR